MQVANERLWSLARGGQHIDAGDLASAIEEQAVGEPLDFRTRLLIRDALEALNSYWGSERFADWIERSQRSRRLRRIRVSDLGSAGFPTLIYRIMDATRPNTVLQFFRDLGSRVSSPVRIDVGGSTSLILAGTLSRHTDDIDVVDEVPADLRAQHDLLQQLAHRYGLALTHFRSHYLPVGWANRVRSLDWFGKLDVFLVDVYDVLLGKLFSQREKDLDDLRSGTSVDKAVFESRLRQAGGQLLGETDLAENAKRNWYVIYGGPLPS